MTGMFRSPRTPSSTVRMKDIAEVEMASQNSTSNASVDNKPGVVWLDDVPLSREDKDKIFHGNARRLLKLK